MINVSFSICCSLFIFLLSIIYFSKQKVNNFDNKVYSSVIILNIIGICIDVLGYFSFKKYGVNTLLNHIISKTYLIYFISYVFVLLLYTYNLTFKNLTKILKKIILSFLFICLIIFCLPIKITYTNKYAYTSGLSVNVAYFLGFVFIILMIFCLIKAGKNLRKKAYIPMLSFVIFMIICLIIQKINPEITLLLTANSIVTFLMYFTIENPDVQVINELYKNKILVEKAYDDKSNFLFRMTQEIRKPIKNIRDNLKLIEENEEPNNIKRGLNQLDFNCKQLDFVVNDILNVTTIDYKNIKIINNKYNIYQVFEEIQKRININKIDNVEYRFQIDSKIPELYGDQIRLKQILISILLNSIKKTTSGFIELNINSIIKYDTCRLIITIEDSGCGMSIDKANDLLITTGELRVEDIQNLEKLDLNLSLCQKIIKVLGGNLMIRSEVGKGTEVIITIDQKVYTDGDNINDLDDNKKYFTDEKTILITNDNEQINRLITRKLREDNIIISNSLYGKDLIGKIRTGKTYDIIFINDNLEDMSGLNTMQEIRKLNYKKPLIIILDKQKYNIRNHYIEEGFTDYILLDDDIEKKLIHIKDKYL